MLIGVFLFKIVLTNTLMSDIIIIVIRLNSLVPLGVMLSGIFIDMITSMLYNIDSAYRDFSQTKRPLGLMLSGLFYSLINSRYLLVDIS